MESVCVRGTACIVFTGSSSHTCVNVIFIASLYGNVVEVFIPCKCIETVCYTVVIDQCEYLFCHSTVEVFFCTRYRCCSCLCRCRCCSGCCGILLRGISSSTVAASICSYGIHSRLFGYDVPVTYITSGVIPFKAIPSSLVAFTRNSNFLAGFQAANLLTIGVWQVSDIYCGLCIHGLAKFRISIPCAYSSGFYRCCCGFHGRCGRFRRSSLCGSCF